MPKPPVVLNEISSLLQIVADLRGPEGCPWDKEQTHQTLAKYAIEETFEMVETIESKDDPAFCDELGDVLFQVVLHSQLATERGAFSFQDVIQAISEKIVRRHPHVFSNLGSQSKDQVLKKWDEIKAEEKKKKSQPLNGVPGVQPSPIEIPKGLPALQAADKIGQKTEKFNFDWSHPKEVLRQMKLEIAELEEALDETVSPDAFDHITHELGDVLFTMAQLCRKLKVDPEFALRDMNRRFVTRFSKMIEILKMDQTITLSQTELDFEKANELILDHFKSMDREKKELLWIKAKKILAESSTS